MMPGCEEQRCGVGANSRVTYTTGGTHYIRVRRLTYTLSVIVLGANGALGGDTDFPADNTTTGRVEVGASATGNSATDYDYFRVELEAGKTYQRPGGHSPTTLADSHLAQYPRRPETMSTDGNGHLRQPDRTTPGTYYLVAISGERPGHLHAVGA